MDKPNTQTIEDHLTRIQQIDELARRTITDQQRRIPEKYSNIEATLKLLTNLIHSFKKRSESHELQLKGRAKIDDLIDQITFHKARVLECEQMSATLMQKINERRQAIEREEERVRKLRKGIIELKTDNVKKIIRLEQLEKEDKNVVEKENLETRRNTWKVKTEVNREFYKEINR
jgi:vacuolar-type H+-ATPase subunit I/STV1